MEKRAVYPFRFAPGILALLVLSGRAFAEPSRCPCQQLPSGLACLEDTSYQFPLNPDGSIEVDSVDSRDVRVMAAAFPRLLVRVLVPPASWASDRHVADWRALLAGYLASLGVQHSRLEFSEFAVDRSISLGPVFVYRNQIYQADRFPPTVLLEGDRVLPLQLEGGAFTKPREFRFMENPLHCPKEILVAPTLDPEQARLNAAISHAMANPRDAGVPCVDASNPTTHELMVELGKLQPLDPCAARLLERLAQTRVDDADIPGLWRFLDGEDRVWAPAVGLMAPSGEPWVRVYLVMVAAGLDGFRSARAALALLEHHGDEGAFQRLRDRVLNRHTPGAVRRNLAPRWFSVFIRERPVPVLSAFIALLGDDDLWMRYNAFSTLKQETGNTFGYRYREVPAANQHALAAWQAWLAVQGGTWRPGSVSLFTDSGISLRSRADGVAIEAVTPESVWARAGLARGDTILEVDGDSAQGKTAWELDSYELAGVEGSVAELKVRPADGALRTVKIKRKFELPFSDIKPPPIPDAYVWTEVERPLPELNLVDLTGRTWKRSDLLGKVVFINFWATWCKPCTEEMPLFNMLADKFRQDTGVAFLSINVDDLVSPVQPVVTREHIRVPVLRGWMEWMAENNGGSAAIPQNVVADAGGTVRFYVIGSERKGKAWVEDASRVIQKVRARANPGAYAR